MLVALFTTALFTPAWAVECHEGPLAVNVAADRPVPTNVHFLVQHGVAEGKPVEMELLGPGGTPLELKSGRRAPTSVELTPKEPLSSSATYRLHDKGAGRVDVTFRTGPGPDVEKPMPPRVLTTERQHATSTYGDVDRLLVVVEPSSDAHHWEVQIATDLTFLDALTVRSPDPAIGIGTERCVVTAAGYDRRVRYQVRVRAVDAAGNVSPWVMPPPSEPTIERSW